MRNANVLIDGVNVVVAPSYNPPPDMLQAFDQADVLYFDTETTGLSPWTSELALLQIYEPNSKQCLLARIGENWKPEPWVVDLWSKGKTFAGHNIAGFDLHFLALAGVPWAKSKYFDTLIGESIISTTNRSGVSKSLRASVKRRTGYEVDKSITHGRWRAEDLDEKQIIYGATDVLVLPELFAEQNDRASQTGQTNALAMEMEVMPVFTRMSLNGLPIDRGNLSLYLDQQKVNAAKAEQILNERLGAINYNSPVQLKRALASIGIDLESTAKDALIDIILFDPDSENAKLLKAILDWRAPAKRSAMYGSIEWQNEHIQWDDRVHARFWQVGADTTRVSSSDPNLQQVPKDGRWIFGNVPGHKIVSVDYSQVEVRIAADICNDQDLIRLLVEDDVHRAIAAQVFACHPADVTPKQRKLAKAMVFTLLFGGGPKRFWEYARHNGSEMEFDEAVSMFQAFFRAFQGLWNMRQKAYAICRTRNSAVITLPNGARRVLAGRSMTPSIILNTPVQGTAAVGMKLGLIEAGKKHLDIYLGAVVHDEAVACVPDDIAEPYARAMQDCLVRGMQSVVHNCPIKAEIARNKDGSLPNVWLA
jgi:DNA polymerase I-like protein with 3'-5' exonuclease and polymerase domains